MNGILDPQIEKYLSLMMIKDNDRLTANNSVLHHECLVLLFILEHPEKTVNQPKLSVYLYTFMTFIYYCQDVLRVRSVAFSIEDSLQEIWLKSPRVIIAHISISLIGCAQSLTRTLKLCTKEFTYGLLTRRKD